NSPLQASKATLNLTLALYCFLLMIFPPIINISHLINLQEAFQFPNAEILMMKGPSIYTVMSGKVYDSDSFSDWEQEVTGYSIGL
ncbi:hypothetical protein L3V82_11790, partial [Thiotrichales bacterium 19S3-7]|nr:hypothetical protein [Thiotrichales bacterium 19S3-7]MCF6802895.1 hypothetical protein [Thiotrichales bacterium 19S3-11]